MAKVKAAVVMSHHVEHDLAYLACGQDGFHVMDVADPAAQVVVGNLFGVAGLDVVDGAGTGAAEPGEAAALLAWAAADKGDRVGGLVFDEHGQFECRPAARTRGLLPLLNALADASHADALPATPDVTQAASRLSQAGRHLVHLVRPGSLVFLISDFAGFDDDGAWLAHLGAGSELVLVHTYDPLEAAPPPSPISMAGPPITTTLAPAGTSILFACSARTLPTPPAIMIGL